MFRKPHHSVPPTGELRFEAFVEQVETLSEEHASERQRALYGDIATILHDPNDELYTSFKALTLLCNKKTPSDLANSVAKQIILLEVLNGVPSRSELTTTFDASSLEPLTNPGSWLDAIHRIHKADALGSFIAGCQLPTQTNYPDRWSPIKLTLRNYGLERPVIAELGTAAGWLLKLGIVEQAGFPVHDIRTGTLSRTGRHFRQDPALSKVVNERLHAPGFSIERAKGFDLMPIKSPFEQARAKIYTLYIEQLLDDAAQADLQRLIDYPWPSNLELTNEDLSIAPEKFKEFHADDIGQYDAVIVPTMVNQLPSRREQANVIQNAHLLRRLGGMIIFQDYGKFIYPDGLAAIRKKGRNVLMMSPAWNRFTYTQWVDDGSHGDTIHFEPVGRFMSGRADTWALNRRTRRQLLAD